MLLFMNSLLFAEAMTDVISPKLIKNMEMSSTCHVLSWAFPQEMPFYCCAIDSLTLAWMAANALGESVEGCEYAWANI